MLVGPWAPAAVAVLAVLALALFLAVKRLTLPAHSSLHRFVPPSDAHDERSRWLGDEVADRFLAEKGPLHIYNSADLASELGLRSATLPAWMDVALSEEGRQFQRKWIGEILGSGLSSLVESVGYVPGNIVLAETGRLMHAVPSRRRLLESGNFSFDLIEHGLSPASPGLETLARVRLLHAMVRRHMTSGAGKKKWRAGEWGVPVSQEDSVHTLLMMSYVVLRSLAAQGVVVSGREQQAMSMFWSHAGRVSVFLFVSFFYSCHRVSARNQRRYISVI
jgi:hypothetical protein